METKAPQNTTNEAPATEPKKQPTQEDYMKYQTYTTQLFSQMAASVKPGPNGVYNFAPCFQFINTQVTKTYDLVFAARLVFVLAGTVNKTVKDQQQKQKVMDQCLVFVNGFMHAMGKGTPALKGQMYNEMVMSINLPIFKDAEEFRFEVLKRLTKNIAVLGTHEYLTRAVEKEMKASIEAYNIDLTDKLEALLKDIEAAKPAAENA